MKRTLTRADRRRMRRHADSIAAVMAATTLHPAGGRLRPITDPAGLDALQRGYAAMIRAGCAPVVLRLTEAEARALPGWRPTPPGASWWLACGLDVDLRGTWVARWGLARGLTEAEEADAAEVVLLEALARVANVSGIPGEVVR